MKFYKLIKPKQINNYKGNILKYFLNDPIFKKGIKDFYFTKIKPNHTKGWKFKKRKTILIVIEGSVKFYFKNKKNLNIKELIINSKDKEIIIIQKNIFFSFKSNLKKTSVIMSLLNDKYN